MKYSIILLSLLSLLSISNNVFCLNTLKEATTTLDISLDVIHNGKKAGNVKLPAGRIVIILNESPTQYKVRSNGLAEGWVDKDKLSINKQPQVATSKKTMNSSEIANVNLLPDAKLVEVEENRHVEQKTKGSSNTNKPQDSNIIHKPGEIVFLRMDFSKQEHKNDCASNLLLQISDFLGNRYDLTQNEFSSLLNTTKQRASWSDMERALNQIGRAAYPHYIKPPKGSVENEKLGKLKESLLSGLDSNVPALILKKDDASIIVGYNLSRNVYYAWDQNRTMECKNTIKVIPNAPKGTYEIPIDSVTDKADTINGVGLLVYYNKIGKEQVYENTEIQKEATQIKNIANGDKVKGLFPHRFVWMKTDQQKKVSQAEYLKLAKTNIPVLLAGLVKNNRKIAIPLLPLSSTPSQKDLGAGGFSEGFIFIESFSNNHFSGVQHPKNEAISLSKGDIVNLILVNTDNDGARYWSFTQD